MFAKAFSKRNHASCICFSTQDTITALELLTDARLEKEAELQKVSSQPDLSDSDEETDSPRPLYDSVLCSGGSKAILEMTKCSSPEFNALWNGIEANVRVKWNTGKGHQSKHTLEVVLFMVLELLKHGRHCDFLGRMFHIKRPTFERMITKFVQTISDDIVQHLFTTWIKNTVWANMCVRKILQEV